MINAEAYIHELILKLKEAFGKRLAYVGLQGSYLRGEATENSDLDIMAVIDGMAVTDLDTYRSIIESMDHFDKSCGFICSAEDLSNWNPLEICGLLHSTRDYHGTLAELVPAYTREDVRNFAKVSVNNLYHEICHRYLHGSAEANHRNLPFTYKGVFFILQTVHYLRTGDYIATKRELLQNLTSRDRTVMEYSLNYPKDKSFRELFETLFLWCQETLVSL